VARYVATINTPGYLPQDDDPPTFDTVHEAWHYLAEERERHEDEQEQDEGSSSYSDTALCLEHCATEVVFRCEFGRHHFPEHEGSFWGPTPGTDSDHDLGLVYAVTEVEHEHEWGIRHHSTTRGAYIRVCTVCQAVDLGEADDG